MKKTLYSLACAGMLIPAYAFSQTKNESENVSRSITKKIEINEENGVKTVKVETSENGNTTTEIYEGDAADEYLNNKNSMNGIQNQNFHFRMHPGADSLNSFHFKMDDRDFNFHFNVDSLMKNLNFDWNTEMGNFREEMKKLEEELKQLKFEMPVFEWNDSLLNFKNGNQQMIIIDDAELDEKTKEELKRMGIDIEIEKGSDKKVVSKVVVARVVLIEDMEQDKKQKEIEGVDLGFYPNPGNGDFTLEFTIEDDRDEAVISIHDLTGKQVYTETVKGKGNYKKQISLSEPSGVYIIKIQQGKKAITKKLIIQ